jgi:hypothetical protein
MRNPRFCRHARDKPDKDDELRDSQSIVAALLRNAQCGLKLYFL